MRVAVVHTPEAGDEDIGGRELREAVDRAGHDLDYRRIDDPGWDHDLGRSHDLVVAAGGDGTVRQVFAAVAPSSCPASIVALGTANNVARTLGIPVDEPLAWVAGWSDAAMRPFDVPTITTKTTSMPVIESVGAGLFTRLLAAAEREGGDEDVNDDEVWERFQRVVADAPAEHWTLELDGRHESGAYLGVQVMNIREVGSRVALAPDADPGDGALDVVLIGPDDRDALVRYGGRRRHDDAVDTPRLRVHRATRVAARASAGCPVAVDDKPWAVDADDCDLTVAVGHRSLPVLRPG